MRWPVVRLIAAREARDQLRDRRTLFMILGLPIFLYLLLVGVAYVFVRILQGTTLVVGVVGAEHLPPPPAAAAADPRAYPPLFDADGRFRPEYVSGGPEAGRGGLAVVPLQAADEGLLANRRVDAIVVFEPDTAGRLDRQAGRPVVRVLGRDAEENSKLAVRRVTGVLRRWADDVKAVKFRRNGLDPLYDAPLDIRDPQADKPADKKVADELRDGLVKVVPLLLVMWVLTGAIYPAVDMTAGEKERGTMETLLISPAERSEIVLGKFLAVSGLGFGTAVWNALLLAVILLAGPRLSPTFPFPQLSAAGLAAGVLLAALPLAMLFAAGCLSLGVFARSIKEGNYYIVPMFLAVLPLAYLSMAPGMELDGRTSWVPVTNALLLQQRLMSVRPDPFPWQHLPAVVLSLSACIAVGLWLAVRQFKREAVLFREAEAAGGGRGFRLFGKRTAE